MLFIFYFSNSLVRLSINGFLIYIGHMFLKPLKLKKPNQSIIFFLLLHSLYVSSLSFFSKKSISDENHPKPMKKQRQRALVYFIKRAGKPLQSVAESLNEEVLILNDSYDILGVSELGQKLS